MNIFLSIVGVVALLLIGFIFYLGYSSSTGTAIGLADGRLAPCPDKPNCVCTEYSDDSEHFAAALVGVGQTAEAIAEAVRATGGVVVNQTMNGKDIYTSATYTSGLFRFVDDVEFRFSAQDDQLHIRSASRVGHSDLGANAKRYDALKAVIK